MIEAAGLGAIVVLTLLVEHFAYALWGDEPTPLRRRRIIGNGPKPR